MANKLISKELAEEGQKSTILLRSESGVSNIYREISRKQYIASFGNIASEAIFRKYRDILTIFVMYDFGHFWPEIDLKTIATNQFSCVLACDL